MRPVPTRLHHAESGANVSNDKVQLGGERFVRFDDGEWSVWTRREEGMVPRKMKDITHREASELLKLLDCMNADVVMGNYLKYCEAREAWIRDELIRDQDKSLRSLSAAIEAREHAESELS